MVEGSRGRAQMNRCFLRFFFLVVYYFIYLFIYFWLCWVFVAARGLSLVPATAGYSLSQCMVLSLRWPLPLQSTGSRLTGSVVVARRRQSAGPAVVVHGLSSCGSRA